MQQYSVYQININNAGFINQNNQPQINPISTGGLTITLNGEQIPAGFNNNQDYIYLFGYPINYKNPDGMFLMKIAQIQLEYTDGDNYYQVIPFYNDIQFARLFCLWYGCNYMSLQQNKANILVALCMFFYKYHYVQPNCTKANSNLYIYKDQIGTIRQLCFNMYKEQGITQLQKFLGYLVKQSNKINQYYIQNPNTGYVVPDKMVISYTTSKYDMYSLIYQMEAYMAQDNFASFNLYVQNLTLNITDSNLNNVNINQYITTQEDIDINQPNQPDQEEEQSEPEQPQDDNQDGQVVYTLEDIKNFIKWTEDYIQTNKEEVLHDFIYYITNKLQNLDYQSQEFIWQLEDQYGEITVQIAELLLAISPIIIKKTSPQQFAKLFISILALIQITIQLIPQIGKQDGRIQKIIQIYNEQGEAAVEQFIEDNDDLVQQFVEDITKESMQVAAQILQQGIPEDKLDDYIYQNQQKIIQSLKDNSKPIIDWFIQYFYQIYILNQQ